MSNTVLIIGPNYFNYLTATAKAFERQGWTSVVESYDNPIHPYTTFMKWRWKLSRNREKLQARSRREYNRFILERFESVKPQMVFIMNGEILESSTLDAFRKQAKVGLWMFDTRHQLSASVGHIDHVDAMFCYEKTDSDWYLEQGKQAYFLPQACDTDTYFPMNIKKDIDILFVGNLYTSSKRMETIQAVVNRFPDRIIRVYGLYKPWYKGFLKWLFRERRDVYKNKTVAPDQVNELYNRSRVVLNIHHEHQVSGANPRTFEIIGSGSWQVCDANPYIEEIFSNDEIGLYHNQEELFALIEKGLTHNMSADAQKAKLKLDACHTFDVRVREVIEKLA